MIEIGKQYKTRDGREGRIYAVDAGGMYPIHGAIQTGSEWCITSWTRVGEQLHGNKCQGDLIEVKPARTEWLNINGPNWRSDTGCVHPYETRSEADDHAMPERIACIQITFREGDGL